MAALWPLLLYAGCLKAGPDFKPSPAPVASNWKEAGDPAVDSDRQEYQGWWKVINDPVLTKLINDAFHQNLTLMARG